MQMQRSEHRYHTYIINLEKRKDRRKITEKKFLKPMGYTVKKIQYQKIKNRMEPLMLKRTDFKNNSLKLSLND